MSEFSRYDRYIARLIRGEPFDFADKGRVRDQHISYMLNRMQTMTRINGLPDTMPERDIKLMLHMNGHFGMIEHNGELYGVCGGLGGEPNAYYMPTLYTVANPALKIGKSYKIDEDITIIPNDSLYMGLLPLFERYATAISETELSIKLATINSRIMSLLSAPDDRTLESVNNFLADIENGKLGSIGESQIFDGLRVQPYATSGNTNGITSLIELEQYLKASWYNEIGLNANYNMKRESINSGESQLNNDMLLPLVDDMLQTQNKAFEKANKMFGTNISVVLNSAWEDNQEEIDKALEDETEPEMENEGGENVEQDNIEQPL